MHANSACAEGLAALFFIVVEIDRAFPIDHVGSLVLRVAKHLPEVTKNGATSGRKRFGDMNEKQEPVKGNNDSVRNGDERDQAGRTGNPNQASPNGVATRHSHGPESGQHHGGGMEAGRPDTEAYPHASPAVKRPNNSFDDLLAMYPAFRDIAIFAEASFPDFPGWDRYLVFSSILEDQSPDLKAKAWLQAARYWSTVAPHLDPLGRDALVIFMVQVMPHSRQVKHSVAI